MPFTVLKCTEHLLFSTEEIFSATDKKYLLKTLFQNLSGLLIINGISLLGGILTAPLFNIF
jgi:hypothetical protein